MFHEGFGHQANQCATPPQGKFKNKGRDDTKGKGKEFNGGGKVQGGGRPCGHCGKTGHGPSELLDAPPRPDAAKEDRRRRGRDVGCVEFAAPF